MDEDDDIPQLPADTLQALQDFHAEKDARAKQFESLRSQAEDAFQHGQGKLSMDVFGEDWNASQFWYTDATATTLARQLLAGATAASAIAVVSAPSVYVALRNLLAADGNDAPARPRLLRLFEFDERFAVLGSDFVHYDFRQPLRLPAELRGAFDRIICDPPFLSDDCQTKTAMSVRALMVVGEKTGEDGDVRFVACTGERMEATVLRLYAQMGVRTTSFEPKHSKGLSNEFRCYANFECGDWTWRPEQSGASGQQ